MTELKFDAVLFDLDGTLLDTLEDLGDSMNAVLAARGHPTHALEGYRYFVGDGIEKLVERTLPEEARDAETVAVAVEEMRSAYREHWNVKSRPYDGVEVLLAELRIAGLRLVVYSNKPDAFTRLCVDELLDPSFFEIVRGAQGGVPCKPDPTAAIGIAEELGVAPERILYLGDTNTDMRTAVGAGMYPVGAAWGFRPAEELVEAGAAVVIGRPEELLELIQDELPETVEVERNLGPQPLGWILEEKGLAAKDLVAASMEQLTHKMVARAIKGRRLTLRAMGKVLRALEAATGESFELGQLFNYE